MNQMPRDSWARASTLGFATSRVPLRDYTAPEVFAHERDQIFRKIWLLVARVEEVPAPGDFLRVDIATTRSALVIVRGADGTLRAFHNACAHRGVALVCEASGNARGGFRCPYHAWTYGTDGALKGIPGPDFFPEIDKREHGLAPVALAVWNGFVFINLAAEPRESLEAFLGDFGAQFAEVPFGDYPFAVEMAQSIGANWKSIINAFNEAYHIPSLHRQTLGAQVVSRDNPHLQFYDPRLFGPHSAVTLGRNGEWQPEGEVLRFVVKEMMPAALPDMEAMLAGRGIAGHPAINRIKLPNFQIELLTLFPNTLLQILPSGWFWFQFWPTAPDAMEVIVRMYSGRTPTSFREEFAATQAFAQGRDVLTEDMAMVRLQQIGLESRGQPYQHFGENEYLLRFFCDAVWSWIETGLAEDAAREVAAS